jgi:hypothetical protein
MQESWKDIKGYEDLYQVSNLGRVKSTVYKKEKILIPKKISKGYYRIKLNKNKEIKRIMLHRLVAEAFIPNPQNKPQVNHKDGDKSNNCVENLEWCTPKENVQHAIQNNLFNNSLKTLKENNIKSRKKIQQFDLKNNFIKEYECLLEIKNAGFCSYNVRRVCRKERKTAYGFIWKYIE